MFIDLWDTELAYMLAGSSIEVEGGVLKNIREVEYFFFSSRRRHTILQGDWSSDVCSSDLSSMLTVVVITTTVSIDDRNIPVNNPLTSGTGTGLSSLTRLTQHTTTFNTQVARGLDRKSVV